MRFSFRLFVLFLFLFSLSVLSAYVYAVFTWEIPPTQIKAILTISTVPLFLLLSLIAFWPEKKNVAVPSRRRYLRWGLIAVMAVFFLFQVIDTAPPESKYSFGDITSDDPELKVTTLLLEKLCLQDSPITNLLKLKEEKGFREIEQHSRKIESVWHEIAPEREAVAKLVTYSKALHKLIILEDPLPQWDIRKVAAIYHSKILLLARKGDISQALDHLCLFHSVSKKGLEGAVNIIQKMLWTVVLRDNMRTAFQVVYEYDLSDFDLSRLAEAFAPFTMEEITFKKAWIGEYIGIKRLLELPINRLLEARYLIGPDDEPLWKKVPSWVLQIPYRLTFQKNRTVRMIDNLWEPMIEKSKTSLNSISALNDIYMKLTPPLRNLSGWFFHQPPIFIAYEKRLINEKVKSDLLSKHLNYKLKRKNYIPAYLIGSRDNYAGLNGKLVSAGEDDKFRTKDDIVLEVFYRK